MLSSVRYLGRAFLQPRQCHKLVKYRLFHDVSLLDDLAYRGFIQDVTRPEALSQALQSKPQAVYSGVDPSASSLHIGHLLPFMTLLHFQIRGHQIIPLIGGATGRVGDPSGRLTERKPADIKQVEDNVVKLTESIQFFFSRALEYAKSRLGAHGSPVPAMQSPAVLSNLEWHEKFTMLDFLQFVGKHVRVNTMLNRESVRARLESQQGISFTEFTYQLLQAYDFHHLHKHHNCGIQVGGSDQWGNILAGLELIGRRESPSATAEPTAYGLTTPLLTTSTGEKFGKSAGNAVWLDPNLTSIFDFYQYFLKVTDDDVEKYLKLFTLLPRSTISQIIQTHQLNPEKRIAQRQLAAEVTELVHKHDGVIRAETLTKMFFESHYEGLKAEHVKSALEGDPRLVLLDFQEIRETPVAKLAAKYGLVASNSAAKNLIASHGLYLNNQAVPEVQYTIQPSSLIDNRIAILRAGKGKLLVLVEN
ncbi:tyrosyl-tRNA synthetase [Macrolepiota fuliginosa MF-IS2]|uniref:Tyrosine--tRNA ligase n=1 Tax=Macrolepiota fuliginosa MF-IS2 TaxID=1400762 RepID=A0A9P6C6L5_9AGAR|nr:tyrosyl-tRNA synthetase [Macrolepiota fuliginosa MF-IS2]